MPERRRRGIFVERGMMESEHRRCDIISGLKRTNVSLHTELGFTDAPNYTDAASPVTLPKVDPPPLKDPPKSEDFEGDGESQVQTLYLDNKRKRKITIKTPFTVTKEELERIRSWLGFQLIIEGSNPNPEQQ
jgi:hypothetical protein